MPYDETNLYRYASSLPTRNPGSLMTVVRDPNAWSVGGNGGDMLVRQTDPQKIAKSLAFLRAQLEGAGAGEGGGSYAGLVLGDTPGQAQSQLLSLRAQNIAMAEAAARRQDMQREAAVRREEVARQNQILNAFSQERLRQSAVGNQFSQEQAIRDAELRKLLGVAGLQTRLAEYGRKQPAPLDYSAVDELAPYGEALGRAETTNQDQMDALLEALGARSRQVAMDRNLMLNFDSDGLPSFGFLDTTSRQPKELLQAENEAYSPAGRDYRAELARLISEENRLGVGRQTYQSDYDQAVKFLARDQPTPTVTVPRELQQLMELIRQMPTGPTANPRATTQRGGSRRTTVPPTAVLPPVTTPKVWRLRGGQITPGR